MYNFPAATDHHSVEQREATTQSEQMASHARPPHCNRRQEEGEGQCQSQLTLTPAVTFEWQQGKLSVARSVYESLSVFFYISYFLSPVFLIGVYFSLSWSCISEMFTDPATQISNIFACVSPFHCPPPPSPHKTKSIMIHSSQSLSMIYCNIIISHSFLKSLKSQTRQHIVYSSITKIHYCISPSDHQSVSTSRCHRDRSSTKSGRGYSTTD